MAPPRNPTMEDTTFGLRPVDVGFTSLARITGYSLTGAENAYYRAMKKIRKAQEASGQQSPAVADDSNKEDSNEEIVS
ncbi:uncharacterized protein N7483_005236 [Penicillium malachiteum]|uniref:uncharacterized protein n=1 Tax=Penicillium malachiteum TaxID=1324776 RepID=UPI00254670A8|nr:uncharacterized protein N7483_005236 [Penicillium malachiteum]KAJ5730728.1 hypothetical protein N7483_005236 [Penicillium malachiteum]